MRASLRVVNIQRPPIAEIAEAADELERTGRRVIRLSQAVPWFGPPEWALNESAPLLHQSLVHRYSPDPGLPEIRELVAERWFSNRALHIDHHGQLHLTCGASQAFLSALAVSADPGETVVLSDPYYFDHLYAVQILDLKPQFVPMIESQKTFAVDLERIVYAVRGGARVVVLVDPANPTGNIVPTDELRVLAGECAAHDCTLIIDETYQRFRLIERNGWHPWMDQDTARWTLTIGSFSKSLGMAGWRLGYLFGSEKRLDQAIKVQDSVTICAPLPAQILLQQILKGPFEEWFEEKNRELLQRRALAADVLMGKGSPLKWRENQGAFFSFLAYGGTADSYSVAKRLLLKYGVALVPGSAFGAHGDHHLRLSYGSPSLPALHEALALLGSVTTEDLA